MYIFLHIRLVVPVRVPFCADADEEEPSNSHHIVQGPVQRSSCCLYGAISVNR